VALKEGGHRGVLHAVSRRGLLPQPHRVSMRPPAALRRAPAIDGWPNNVRGILRSLRREIRQAAAEGIDWREVLTALRSDTPRLWQSLSVPERRKFLRHLRPFWETHRHRAAPEMATTIAELVARQELIIHAGRVTDYVEDLSGVSAGIRYRGGGSRRTLKVGRVINCTGPETDLRRVDDGFVQRLLDDGLVRPDPLGLGIDTDSGGNVLDASGRPLERVFLVGPLRKGQLWEHTAVPELRVAAVDMARRLVEIVSGAAGS
jgi:uncharacterized NAD(P)/FAD-binding protein YdhS